MRQRRNPVVSFFEGRRPETDRTEIPAARTIGGKIAGKTLCAWLSGTAMKMSTMIEIPTTVARTLYQVRAVFTRSTVLR